MKQLFAFTFLLIITACGSQTEFEKLISKNNHFDIAIVNGDIIDGSGADSYRADLLIRDDAIAFVGKIDLEKITVNKTIDAEGKIVSPGFIDVHAHGNPLSEVSFESFLATGVTTMVLGQDGGHPSLKGQEYDILPWMDKLEQSDLELNVAMFVGHGSLRRQAQIPNEKAPSTAQLSSMETALEAALKAGCFGISTGLEYVPGMYADKLELQALAKIVGANDAVMMSHMRNEDDEAIEASLDELLELGELCQVHASHLKVVYGKGAKRGQEILQKLANSKKSGIQISADVYPYMASYTGIGILFPSWCKTNAQFERAKLDRLDELKEYLFNRVIKRNGPEATLFGSGEYAGNTLAQVAAAQNKSYVDILMQIGPQGASGAYFIMDQLLQDEIITDPKTMIASDGSPTMLHPRGHGTQARIIEKYVEEKGVLELSLAIYKMTGLPAKTINLKDRGLLVNGYIADILIFNPSEVKEKATYENPYQFSEGFDQVILNGKLVREDGALLIANGGKLLRSNSGN
jgi:N-acyl-D-aspartate/D-glutamate deacylase